MRNGDWMQTFTGRQFWPIDPHADDVCIEDIAHALSMLCRFTGHCRVFYSVAEHSVFVSRLVPKELAMWGLLHDASEAYIADVGRPAKRFLNGYEGIEDRIMRVVCGAFNLDGAMPVEVKRADNAMLAAEARQLMWPHVADWNLSGEPAEIEVEGLEPRYAEHLFLERFHEVSRL